MSEMLTILTDVRSVCLSVSRSDMRLKLSAACAVYAVCVGSFGAAFAKCLWPLVTLGIACVNSAFPFYRPVPSFDPCCVSQSTGSFMFRIGLASSEHFSNFLLN